MVEGFLDEWVGKNWFDWVLFANGRLFWEAKCRKVKGILVDLIEDDLLVLPFYLLLGLLWLILLFICVLVIFMASIILILPFGFLLILIRTFMPTWHNHSIIMFTFLTFQLRLLKLLTLLVNLLSSLRRRMTSFGSVRLCRRFWLLTHQLPIFLIHQPWTWSAEVVLTHENVLLWNRNLFLDE